MTCWRTGRYFQGPLLLIGSLVCFFPFLGPSCSIDSAPSPHKTNTTRKFPSLSRQSRLEGLGPAPVNMSETCAREPQVFCSADLLLLPFCSREKRRVRRSSSKVCVRPSKLLIVFRGSGVSASCLGHYFITDCNGKAPPRSRSLDRRPRTWWPPRGLGHMTNVRLVRYWLALSFSSASQ